MLGGTAEGAGVLDVARRTVPTGGGVPRETEMIVGFRNLDQEGSFAVGNVLGDNSVAVALICCLALLPVVTCPVANDAEGGGRGTSSARRKGRSAVRRFASRRLSFRPPRASREVSSVGCPWRFKTAPYQTLRLVRSDVVGQNGAVCIELYPHSLVVENGSVVLELGHDGWPNLPSFIEHRHVPGILCPHLEDLR